MKTFVLKAINQEGRGITALVKAETRKEAAEIARRQAFEIIDIEPRSFFLARFQGLLSFGGISAWQKSAFFRQLGTMIKAGIPLDRGLKVTAKTGNLPLQSIIIKMLREVQEGKPLYTVASHFPKLFSRVDANLIRAAEATGTLDTALFALAEQKAREASLIKKIRNAMIYPIIVVVVLISAIAIVMVKVIPVLKEVFASARVKLPWTTRALIAISDFMVNFWWLALIFVIALAVFLYLFGRTKPGRYVYSWLKLKLPIVSPLHKNILLFRMNDTLRLLLNAGVHVVESIRLSKGVTNNAIYQISCDKIVSNLENGIPISDTLENMDIYPVIMTHMIRVGEESGTIETMLGTLADYYEEESDSQIKALSSLLEPVVVILLGLGVAFFIFAVMIPIYNLTSIY